ncbi:hypothetical protein [Hydrogenophaga sp. 2FB]|uniref:hypothetical protein n=1 Tax=Hydrogenophaga sp. 2FB TaxID=2502187 RepID=UPI0010F6B660|nr:hypothetical protein [Hydrogenophaga sp. 2FB]
MSVPQSLNNLVRITTRLQEGDRAFINQLKLVKGLTQTNTAYEVNSVGVARFLEASPWRDPNWEWIKPETNVTKVGGVSHQYLDWVSYASKIGDFSDSRGKLIKSEYLAAQMEWVGRNVVVPALEETVGNSHGDGKETAYHNAIKWMLEAVYGNYPRPLQGAPIEVSRDAVVESVMAQSTSSIAMRKLRMR